jgi:hypothetical protein
VGRGCVGIMMDVGGCVVGMVEGVLIYGLRMAEDLCAVLFCLVGEEDTSCPGDITQRAHLTFLNNK